MDAMTMPALAITWIAKMLAGDVRCVWSYWFRAHHQYRKLPSSFDFAGWREDHDAMVKRTAAKYRALSYDVYEERANAFTLVWHGIKIKGRPDLVAVKDGRALVLDCKTGAPHVFHIYQVMLYMLILPSIHPVTTGLPHDGLILYQEYETQVPINDLDAEFKARVREVVQLVGGTTPPPRNRADCFRCDISSDDCPDRVDSVPAEAALDDVF